MQKIYIALIAFLVLASVGVCYAANWQTVTTITGASDQTTDYISIPTNEWRLTWSYTPSSTGGDYAAFSAFIYPKGETAFYTDFVVKTGRDQTSGTIYVHEGIKDYYLEIGAANIQYSIKIEYDKEATASTGSAGSTTDTVIIILVTLVAVAVAAYVIKRKRRLTPYSFSLVRNSVTCWMSQESVFSLAKSLTNFSANGISLSGSYCFGCLRMTSFFSFIINESSS